MDTQVFDERTRGTQSGVSESGRSSSEDKSRLGEMAENVVDSAKQTASSVASKAREQVTSRAEQQRQTAASSVSAVAGAVRKATQELRQQDGSSGVTQYAAEYGETLAEKIECFSSYLRAHSVSQMVGELEDFARARPAYFLGGAFLAGLAASRFLKSSRRRPDATMTAMDRP